MLYSLFKDVPKPIAYAGYLCHSFDGDTYEVAKSEHWQQALDFLFSRGQLSVVAGGHPAVLAQFIKDVLSLSYQKPAGHGDLLLYHYEPDKREYSVQVFLLANADS